MLPVLADLWVQHPARLAGVAVLLLVAWRVSARPNPFWIPGLLWLACAGWEWLVTTRSPDADIRVDLLLIWPVVGATTVWATAVTLLRRFTGASRR